MKAADDDDDDDLGGPVDGLMGADNSSAARWVVDDVRPPTKVPY